MACNECVLIDRITLKNIILKSESKLCSRHGSSVSIQTVPEYLDGIDKSLQACSLPSTD